MLVEITIKLNITIVRTTTSSIVFTEKCEGFMFQCYTSKLYTLDLKYRFVEFFKIEKDIAEQQFVEI